MLKTCIASLLLVAMIAGCGKLAPQLDKIIPDNRTEYKKSKTLPDLEIPPDLTTDAIQDVMGIPTPGEAGTATFSTYQERAAERQRNLELERSETGAIKLLDNEHILAVEGVPAQIWPQLREFWREHGYDLELDDEELGVVETSWNENQEELIRDKFKVFAEPGQEDGTTLLYVSHRGEELVPQGDKLVWQPRTRDIAMERKLVEQIEERLSGTSSSSAVTASSQGDADQPGEATEQRSAASAHAELISAGGGKVYMAVTQDFPAAWKSLASALDRVGIPIEQADESRGLYFVRLPTSGSAEKTGMLSKLKFWDGEDTQFRLSLTGVGNKTEVVVLNEDGKWATSERAIDLLTRLNTEINAGS
jgi:outer membrane protein assembly factor BamC